MYIFIHKGIKKYLKCPPRGAIFGHKNIAHVVQYLLNNSWYKTAQCTVLKSDSNRKPVP